MLIPFLWRGWPRRNVASATTRLVGNSLACLLLYPAGRGFARNARGSFSRTRAEGALGLGSRHTFGHQTKSTMTASAGSSLDKVLPESRPRVCVIGAGAAGLAAGRLLRDEGCHVTVLEKSLHVGGVWRYNSEPREKAPMCESASYCFRVIARNVHSLAALIVPTAVLSTSLIRYSTRPAAWHLHLYAVYCLAA